MALIPLMITFMSNVMKNSKVAINVQIVTVIREIEMRCLGSRDTTMMDDQEGIQEPLEVQMMTLIILSVSCTNK